MGILYLRFLIGGLNVLFVIIVACLTLTLALTISFKSLRDNADTAVSRLGAVTAHKVDDFFATPQRQLDNLATLNRRYRDFGGLPSDSPTFGNTGTSLAEGGEVLQAYRQLMTGLMMEVEFRYFAVDSLFVDGSYLSQIPIYSRTLRSSILVSIATWPTGPAATQQHPLVITGHTVPSGVEHPAITAHVNRSVSQQPIITDMRLPSYRAANDELYNSGIRSGTSRVAWGRDLMFFALSGREFYFLPLTSPMVNTTGFMLGYAWLALHTDGVSDILTEGQLTPATRLVIYDVDGFLFGASSGIRVFTSEEFNGTDSSPGCTTTSASSRTLPSDVKKRACRFHLRDTPIPMVQAAAREDEAFFTQGTTKGAVRLVGSQYVYVQKLPTLQGARAFTIAMVVPEEDMIGDAAKILPICAGVTAGVVVLVAAVSLVLVWLVLRPLQGIAERMGKAARLEADDEAVSVSSLVEIGDLQRAFLEMRDELSRIRAFVPQSLLRANDTADDEEEDDDSRAYQVQPEDTMDSSQVVRLASIDTSSQAESATPRGESAKGITHGRSGQYSFRSGDRVAGDKRKLQLSSGVRRENVSVLSMNLRGFHGAVKDGLGVERVAATVEAVLRIAQQEKGVVDSFHGDRFMISFNAVKPAANHGIRAAIVAARVAESLGAPTSSNTNKGKPEQPKSTYVLPVTAGVATGPAQVGNLGSSEMKRFSIVGPVVSQAACLERLCKLYGGVSCLVPQRLFADLRTAVLVKTVDYVRVPFAERPMLVGAVLRELLQAADDEWMYQLQQAAEGDGKGATDFSPNSAAHSQQNNDVWDALARGRFRDACGLMAKFEERAQGRVSHLLQAAVASARVSTSTLPVLTSTVSLGNEAVEPMGPGMAPHDFGEFYNDALLGLSTLAQQ